MKVSTAIKKLEKNGYTITSEKGTHIATKGNVWLRFFENGPGTDRCSKFTYSTVNSCAPTYGLTLKAAMA